MKYHLNPLHLIALGATFLFVLLFFIGSRAGVSAIHTSRHTVQTTSIPNTQLQAFVGTWYSHGAALIIQSDGSATYTARAYNWCSSGAPLPCDEIKDNIIISGIRMNLKFTHTQGDIAYGLVLKSTTDHIGSPVSLTLAHDHTASFAEVTSGSPHVLCDLHAPAGRCGA